MASSQEYLSLVLKQLSALDDISYRAMMGEYILYFRGRIVGGIYDNRFLVKPVPAAVTRLPDAPHEPPYPGASDMLVVEQIEDSSCLCELLIAMFDQLPPPKPKKKSLP